MHFVPTFLRPLSQIHTGIESGLERKVREVERIESPSDLISFKQLEKIPLWTYQEVLNGETVIEDGTRVVAEKEVDHSDRHWWVVTHGFFDGLEQSLRSHADIFDFLIALNLSTDAPVVFSQSPGQVEGGAYRVRDKALTYRDLSRGQFPRRLLAADEIPTRVEISSNITSIFKMVREFRSMEIVSDEDMDIRIALHMYDDALTSTLWTSTANLYYVCENVLCSGHTRGKDKDRRIEELTHLSKAEAEGWRKTVNRFKHPDTGSDVKGILEEEGLKSPSLKDMRNASNTALVHSMTHRYEELQAGQ